jgi:hypothetical protein
MSKRYWWRLLGAGHGELGLAGKRSTAAAAFRYYSFDPSINEHFEPLSPFYNAPIILIIASNITCN